MALELRKEENREVSFSCIQLSDKKTLWQCVTLPEKWWVSITAFEKGMILAHGYKDPQNPEPKGIYALDENGKLLWENQQYNFVASDDDFLVVADITEENKYKRLNPKTGKEMGVFDEPVKIFRPRNPTIHSNHYSAENIYFSRLSSFILTFTGKTAEASVEYLEHKEKIIISFYAKESEKLVNYLLVINQEGTEEFKEVINEDGKGIALESFFVFNDLLIFIKNKKELVIIEL
ncbi:MAG: DUF4905 domain-containing protein [Cytophagaceae bacterium]|nr:DUF4905 domain-containing protein [Cytophagaceae bacterium]